MTLDNGVTTKDAVHNHSVAIGANSPPFVAERLLFDGDGPQAILNIELLLSELAPGQPTGNYKVVREDIVERDGIAPQFASIHSCDNSKILCSIWLSALAIINR